MPTLDVALLKLLPNRIYLFLYAITACLCFALPGRAEFPHRSPIKWDTFNRLKCVEELARVDNYASELSKSGDALAVIVIYGGRSDTKHGEVIARLFAIRDRLKKYSSIEGNRIVLIDGGFREKLEIELWMIPSVGRNSAGYLAVPTLKSGEAKLKKSVVNSWEYSCGGPLKPALHPTKPCG